MPDTSARIKIEAVREMGGRIDLINTQMKSRAERVAELALEHPEAYVASAYDDPHVIEGNATLGTELAALLPGGPTILAPVGGGGLTAGIIRGLRASGSNMPVWAVEPEIANDAAQSLRTGRIVANQSEPQTIADGVRTISLGVRNWEILRHELAGIIEVSEAQIVESVRLLFHLAHLKVEPTGALGIAGLLAKPDFLAGETVCCVVTGGNVDPELFLRLVAAHD
jgi:threonine dehydratase